jgi:predicted RNase H-like nuclease
MTRAAPVRVVGVDAAGALGWVGVVTEAGKFVGAHVGRLDEIVAWAEPVAVVGVDIPIGHVDGGVRQCDVEARRFVGPRRSSVFAAPPADVLDAVTYAEGNAALAARGMPKLSRQAWALIPKMVEAAELAAVDDRVHEVHPEVSFCALAGSPLPWSKKSWNGQALRRRLLAQAGIHLPDEVPEIAGVAADDLLDAAVGAWSAARIASGTARTLPDPPERSGGRSVAIWY